MFTVGVPPETGLGNTDLEKPLKTSRNIVRYIQRARVAIVAIRFDILMGRSRPSAPLEDSTAACSGKHSHRLSEPVLFSTCRP